METHMKFLPWYYLGSISLGIFEAICKSLIFNIYHDMYQKPKADQIEERMGACVEIATHAVSIGCNAQNVKGCISSITGRNWKNSKAMLRTSNALLNAILVQQTPRVLHNYTLKTANGQVGTSTHSLSMHHFEIAGNLVVNGDSKCHCLWMHENAIIWSIFIKRNVKIIQNTNHSFCFNMSGLRFDFQHSFQFL